VSGRSASPSGGDRARDGLALLLVVVGIVLVLFSNSGMHRLATQPIVVAKGEWAVTQYEHYRRLGLLGYLAALAGVGFGIWSYLLHARRGPAGAGPAGQV
jgi:hypothetical protein